ncbi:MAG: alpha/beta hydrolase [Nitratireductor sp.]|nr:alpha/beta hydrolase [Nitratireductor sp.]
MTRPTRRLFLSAAGAAATTLFLPFSLPGTARAATTKDISYGANRLDIYTPANASGAPVLAFVHGGAWKAGSKGSVGAKARYYTGKGFVFVSIGYTLYPGANAEQQAVQVAQAVNWIKSNIATYGGDGGRVALMGHSAGCHLSALATLSGACTPKLLICNDTGAYDVAYLAEINNGSVPALYSALDRRNQWKRWSPIAYVGNRAQPPTLVMWSGGRNRDRISLRFANAMAAAGNSVTRFDGSTYNHLSINSAIGRNNSVTAAVDRFLQQL